ncbi:hypothetical protein LEP1GSC072_4259, partial [Leptospira noguchii str. Bonito]
MFSSYPEVLLIPIKIITQKNIKTKDMQNKEYRKNEIKGIR